MLQPDVSRTDEVVEVFTGDSLEQAMAYAVAALGPDLQVRRARKVRKGVAGLTGRDKYEVVAAPADAPAQGDPVDSAFDALLSQAEEAEQPAQPHPVRRTTRLAPEQVPRPVTDHDEVLALVQARQILTPPTTLTVTEPELPVLEPSVFEPPVFELPVEEPVAVAVAVPAKPKAPVAKPKAPAAKRTPRTKAARVAAAPSGWSRTALVELGVPEEVLAGLPTEDPTDDLAWAAALAAAIAVVLPAPAALSEADPVVVDGHGVTGALGILRAARLGLTPGTITTGHRTVPASAAELALVLRSAVIA